MERKEQRSEMTTGVGPVSPRWEGFRTERPHPLDFLWVVSEEDMAERERQNIDILRKGENLDFGGTTYLWSKERTSIPMLERYGNSS